MPIPRTLHAFWGGPPMPDHLAGYLARWRQLHPNWDFVLWTPGTLPRLRNQDLFDRPEKYSPKSNPWQWRSDLARYEILHDHGGLYIDCDLEPLKPVDELLDGCTAIVAREDKRMVNNAFMGCTPGDPYLADILTGLRASALARPAERVNRTIGAWYLTRTLRRHPHVRVLPAELIYPLHWSRLDERETARSDPAAYTVHHWANKTSELA